MSFYDLPYCDVAASQPFNLGVYTLPTTMRNGDTGFKLDYTQVIFSKYILKLTRNLSSYLVKAQRKANL